MRRVTRIIALVAAATLVACGGGGGGSSQPQGIDLQAVAIYKARVDGGTLPLFETLVISPDGRFGLRYEDGFGSSRGFVDGVVSGASGSFVGSLTDYGRGGVTRGTVSGTYRPGSGVTAQISYPGVSVTRTYTFDSYPTAPRGTSDAVGTWSASDERNVALAVTVGSDGSLSVSFGAACTVAGSAKFANGANTAQLASIEGIASGGGCRFGAGAMSGLMLVSYTSVGTVQLAGYLARADQLDGFEFRSYRCRDGKTYSYLPLVTC